MLLLGGSGFVGKNMLEHFSSIPGVELDAPRHAELDALDERAVFERLRRCSYDVVLNCLDCSSTSCGPDFAEKRLRMFHNLAAHSDLYGKMIYFGSGAEYARHLPIERVDEADFGRAIPLDSYGFALYQMSLTSLMSKNIYNLRLFGIFGPHENWGRRFISGCICRALEGLPLTLRQNRLMDYLDVRDLALMTEWVATNEPCHHAYNATSGHAYELLGLARNVQDALGISGDVYVGSEGFSPAYTSKNTAIKTEMGNFSPRSMNESISDLISFYRPLCDAGKISRLDLLYPRA